MRLIDADKLLEKYAHPNELIYTFKVIGDITEAKTVYPKSRTVGTWVERPLERHPTVNGIYCSICGHSAMGHYNFCPECGTKMRRDVIEALD